LSSFSPQVFQFVYTSFLPLFILPHCILETNGTPKHVGLTWPKQAGSELDMDLIYPYIGLDWVRVFRELYGLDWVTWLWPRF